MSLKKKLEMLISSNDKRRSALIKDIIGTANSIAEKDNRSEVSDEDVVQAIRKIRLDIKNQLAECPEDRTDLEEGYMINQNILHDYIYKLLTNDQYKVVMSV